MPYLCRYHLTFVRSRQLHARSENLPDAVSSLNLRYNLHTKGAVERLAREVSLAMQPMPMVLVSPIEEHADDIVMALRHAVVRQHRLSGRPPLYQ